MLLLLWGLDLLKKVLPWTGHLPSPGVHGCGQGRGALEIPSKGPWRPWLRVAVAPGGRGSRWPWLRAAMAPAPGCVVWRVLVGKVEVGSWQIRV